MTFPADFWGNCEQLPSGQSVFCYAHSTAVAFAHTEVSGKRQEPMPLVLGHEGGISVDRGLVSMYGQLTMGTR